MAEDPAIAALAETGRKLPPPEARARLAVPPPQALPASTPPPPEPPKLEFYSAASLYGRTIERPPIIINNLIPAGLTVLAGAPKRGKSWMALKMALCIASGEPFLGMATSKGAVLYLDLESKWYNALHTDSAEYKMWGNGIALPCAAFVLGGVAEALMEGNP